MLAFVAIILSTDYRSLPKPAMSVPKIIAGVAFNVPLYAVLLFVPAGKLHWWRASMFPRRYCGRDGHGNLQHFA
jgi:hypothetical protein